MLTIEGWTTSKICWATRVGVSRPPLRSNSSTPSTSSRRLIVLVTVGWAMFICCAAALIEPHTMTERNISSWRKESMRPT
jgi:hypothetical protein